VCECKFPWGKGEGYCFLDVIRKRLLVPAESFSMMDPLAVVEAQLGSADSWPSYELRYMLLLEPNSLVMKKVAGFM